MRLSGEQIKELADFSDGDECAIGRPSKVMLGDEMLSVVPVKRISDNERVRLYENGMIERDDG